MIAKDFRYYLRDDALVLRANDRRVEYWALGEWRHSSIHDTEAEMLRHLDGKLKRISLARAKRLR